MKRITEYLLIGLTIVTLTSIWGLTYHFFGWYGILALAIVAIGLSIYTTI